MSYQYTVTVENDVVRISGAFPVHHFEHLAKLAPNDSIVDQQLTERLNIHIVFGPPAAIESLWQRVGASNAT